MLWILSILSISYFCLSFNHILDSNPVFHLLSFAIVMLSIAILLFTVVKNKDPVRLRKDLCKIMLFVKIVSTVFLVRTGAAEIIFLLLSTLSPFISSSIDQILLFCLMVFQILILTAAYPIATLFAYRKAGLPITIEELKTHTVLQVICIADLVDTVTLFKKLKKWEEQKTGN